MVKPKDRHEVKNALSVIVTALEKNLITKEEMDMLSHALGECQFKLSFITMEPVYPQQHS